MPALSLAHHPEAMPPRGGVLDAGGIGLEGRTLVDAPHHKEASKARDRRVPAPPCIFMPLSTLAKGKATNPGMDPAGPRVKVE